MNAAERTARRAEVEVEVHAQMKALAVLIVTAEGEGAYPDGLPGEIGRVLGLGLIFGPDLPAPPTV